MGRGVSKLNGSGGNTSGNSAQSNNNPLVQRFVDAFNSPGRWTSEQRADLLAAIKNTTDIGDKFVWTYNNGSRVTWTKTGRDKWNEPTGVLKDFTGREMRDAFMVLGNGKMAFVSK